MHRDIEGTRQEIWISFSINEECILPQKKKK